MLEMYRVPGTDGIINVDPTSSEPLGKAKTVSNNLGITAPLVAAVCLGSYFLRACILINRWAITYPPLRGTNKRIKRSSDPGHLIDC